MVKLKKLKKRKIILLVLFLFLFFLLFFRSRNYEKEYSIDTVSILESYNKKEKQYSFLFQVDEKEFFVSFESKYIHKKKLIEEVEVKKKENTICIFPKGKYFSFVPLCMQEGEYVSYHLIEDEEIVPKEKKKEVESKETTYQQLKLYNLNNRTYFVWNYKGFYVIDSKKQQEITLFSSDVYTIPLTTQVDKYLVIADYNSKFVFQKFYVINSQNKSVKELSLEKEIPFDSYFLGTTNKKAYLVDKKNKREYEIYPKRLLIDNITNNNQGKILVEDTFEPISMVSLVTEEKTFTYTLPVDYKIENNTLYAMNSHHQTKLSNKQVKDIVYKDKDSVYYLVEDKLYYYTPSEGEVLVMSNFEWNFNYNNMIYVF